MLVLRNNLNSRKGLRQRESWAPSLFPIAADRLEEITRQAKSKGLLEGISMDNKQISISMLQFVDDTIM